MKQRSPTGNYLQKNLCKTVICDSYQEQGYFWGGSGSPWLMVKGYDVELEAGVGEGGGQVLEH